MRSMPFERSIRGAIMHDLVEPVLASFAIVKDRIDADIFRLIETAVKEFIKFVMGRVS